MSASNKKKLLNQQAAGKLTEKQLEELKKEKETKLYTIGFTVVMALILVAAILVGGFRVYQNSGVIERRTVAYTVGEHKLSSAELGYFFTDGVNNFTQQYGSYAAMFGLDMTKPLNEQFVDEENGTTWADDFLNTAKESAKSVYALVDEAAANNYTISEEEQKVVDTAIENLSQYAKQSGMGSAKAYLKALYGNGASLETYRTYLENSILADSFRASHADSLEYTDEDYREHEKDNYDQYSSFSYNQYYLPAEKFLEGGTTDEEGNVSFSDEEKAASVKACEEAAKELANEDVKTPAALDKLISKLPFNKETPDAASMHYDHKDMSTISGETAAWLADASRKAGDVTYIANTTASQDEEGKSVENTTGYTVLMFGERDDNTDILPNVRHILVSFEGGTANEQGMMTYSEEEKAAAKAKAEELLKQYEDGEKTEDAFAALATENSTDPGSKEKGGLYENVYRGQMVPTFNDWVFEDSRKAGDTGIVETDYGFHVMYYCGEGSMSYRDGQIRRELMSADMDKWFGDLMTATTTVDGDTSRINTALVLSR